jgi:BioD-like phosphotransacetylase family protein
VDKKLEEIAAQIGRNQRIAEVLDTILDIPADRAYVVCSYLDCRHNSKGRCIIYTVTQPQQPAMGQPCDRYET